MRFRSVWEEFEAAPPVDDVDRIERFVLNSGCVAQSLDAMRKGFSRWLRRLHERGVAHIPTASWLAGRDDALAVNLLSLFVLQASPRKDAAVKAMMHHLRDITDTRPNKP